METGDDDTHNAAAASKGSVPPITTKREDLDVKTRESVETNRPTPAPTAQTGTVTGNGSAANGSFESATTTTAKGRSSKTSTPVLAAVTEPNTLPQRVRQTRGTDPTPARRSHKKGAAPVLLPPSEDEESVHEGDDVDEDGEPRYCYCNEISFGDMVACDNDACPREWFHLACVGLTKPPAKNGKTETLPLFL